MRNFSFSGHLQPCREWRGVVSQRGGGGSGGREAGNFEGRSEVRVVALRWWHGAAGYGRSGGDPPP